MNQTRDKRPRNWRWLLLMLSALVIPLLSRLLQDVMPNLKNLELLAYDRHCGDLPPLKPDSRLVVIGMDDDSLDRLFARGEIHNLAYNRKLNGTLIRELHAAGARVIGFDAWFTDPAPVQETRALAEGMRAHGRVVVALKPITDDGKKYRFAEPVAELRPYTLAGSVLFPRAGGGKVRWFLPYPTDSRTQQRYLHFSVALAASYFGDADREPQLRQTFHLGTIEAPLIIEGESIAIRFIGPSGTFQPVPYHEVYDGAWKQKYGADFFRDKLVLIGRTKSQEDRHVTPLGDMQGVEVQANAVQTLLQGNWLRHWNETQNFLLKLGLCLCVVLCVWRLNLFWAWLFAVIASFGWAAACNRLFQAGVWADMIDPLLAVWLTFGVATGIEAWRTRYIFKRFVPSQIADDILRAPDADMTEREVAIVFCDIRSYTALSETLPPETAERLLHDYFLAGEAAADRFQGVLDKFVGDEMMLYFEVKRGRESPNLRAVRWAWAMQEKAAQMDESGAGGEIGFRIGIGISAGKVRFGRVKAKHRLQHTVIGDAVNVASRLQNATKEVQRGIVLSEAAYQPVADQLEAERIGSIPVKGKQEPQTVYYPIRIREEPGG